MTFAGEVSEKQKEEMEKSRINIRHLEDELNEARKNMASLSEIVDQQKNNINQLKSDVR